mmetsp:Transcript_8234/g.11765  ORF Transcript_8234/g.11765 Transcript_8234/m.11765 type:complete len:103 (+) Transcript_8234:689-997(+)
MRDRNSSLRSGLTAHFKLTAYGLFFALELVEGVFSRDGEDDINNNDEVDDVTEFLDLVEMENPLLIRKTESKHEQKITFRYIKEDRMMNILDKYSFCFGFKI